MKKKDRKYKKMERRRLEWMWKEVRKILCAQKMKLGDIFQDCNLHPCICTELEIIDDHIAGISLIDGSGPRSCSVLHCGIQKLTKKEAEKIKSNWVEYITPHAEKMKTLGWGVSSSLIGTNFDEKLRIEKGWFEHEY